MNKKLWIINVIINSIIIVLTIIAVVVMFNGEDGTLTAARWVAFKYFTVQSNIFMAVTSAISLYFLFKKKDHPTWLSILKLVSTTSVGLTFTTVMIYLAPLMGIWLVFQGANLYMHLITPVLAMILYALFEPKNQFCFKHVFFGLIPVVIYGLMYLTLVAVFNDYGNIEGYDWYAFGTYGLGVGIAVLFGLFIINFGISVGMYFLYQKTKIKSLHD